MEQSINKISNEDCKPLTFDEVSDWIYSLPEIPETETELFKLFLEEMKVNNAVFEKVKKEGLPKQVFVDSLVLKELFESVFPSITTTFLVALEGSNRFIFNWESFEEMQRNSLPDYFDMPLNSITTNALDKWKSIKIIK